ncbi:MAG: HDIG domain-containing protein [Spirochaetales bacterium]|nr:HDIG domain-containing protein [Spirochaetales bacterium]
MKKTMRNHRTSESFIKRILPAKKKLRYSYLIVGISFIIANLIIIFATQSSNLFLRYNIGDFKLYETAPSNFVLDRDILWIDEAATEKEREKAAASEPLVFRINDEVAATSINKFINFEQLVLGKNITDTEGKQFSLQALELEQLDGQVMNYLKISPYSKLILENTKEILREAFQTGIIDLTGIEVNLAEIKNIKFLKQVAGGQGVELVEINNVIRIQDLPEWVKEKLQTVSYDDPIAKQVIVALVSHFAKVNGFYDKNQTELDRKTAGEEVKPVEKWLKADSIDAIIVEKGKSITKDVFSKIKAYWQHAVKVNVNSIVGTVFFFIIIFAFTIFLLNKSITRRVLKSQEILLLVVLGMIYLVISVSLLNVFPDDKWYPFSLILPTAVIAILITVVISAEVSVIYSLFLALTLFLIKFEIATFSFAFFSAIGGVAVATRTKERIDLVKAGIYLSVINSIIIGAFGFLNNLAIVDIFIRMAWASGNGFLCGILSLGFLPILEHRLNTPTRFRLMELSDINLPIFKRMLVLAPGTYNHSINMANLAESACEEIGANALLARVASYYHDIGKLDQPEYFIENQNSYNIHDELKPTLSVAVIKSHVKLGVEKAKELNLPQAVIDIITQHHGKAIITYFYNRALKENDTVKKISPAEFSYPGIRPQSKEAAVVMLADSVEAASRTLKKPTGTKIEKLVWGIIVDKFNAGELSECNLTFNDLEIIKKTFVQIVAGYFHQRIEYPKLREVNR